MGIVTGLQKGWLRRITGKPYKARVIFSRPIGPRLGVEILNPEVHALNRDTALSYILKGVAEADGGGGRAASGAAAVAAAARRQRERQREGERACQNDVPAMPCHHTSSSSSCRAGPLPRAGAAPGVSSAPGTAVVDRCLVEALRLAVTLVGS